MTAPRHGTLIDAADLQALLARGAALRILDASFDLADPAAGDRAWRTSHLPGASYVDLERDLSGPKTPRADGRPGYVGGRHPLPTRAAFAATAGRLGIAPGVQVVVYDRQGGIYASRAWWLLRWLGHDATALLDGGADAWTTLAPLESSAVAEPAPLPSYQAAAPHAAAATVFNTVDAETLQRQLGRWPLIDARSAERFRGDSEPLDARAGHIPGALNRPWSLNLAADGRFKPADALRAEFAPLLGDAAPHDVVHQCGSGVTACHNLLAMAHAGLAGSRLYAGSWSDWSSDPQRPVASG